jgi:uncharacterized protein
MPAKFRIYRGHGAKNKLGYSWTLSFSKASWFSARFENKVRVVTGLCNKEDVFAIYFGRGEFEVVIDPKKVSEISVVKHLRRPSELQVVLDHAKSVFRLKMTDHGPAHWEQVERNAIKLADRTFNCDKKVVRLFAILHDCKRENEFDDPDHGRRAAQVAKDLHGQGKLPVTSEQLEKLIYALELHNDGQISDDPTIGACWDADRLDLIRVGVMPDPVFLSTEAGKQLLSEKQ